MKNALVQVGNRLLRYFLAGAFAVLPVVLTVGIVIWMATFLQQFLGPSAPIGRIVRSLGWRFTADDKTLAYLVGWVVVLAIVFLLGVAVETGARRILNALTDAVLNRVPVVGSIYNTSKQLISMLDRQESADLKGMTVVVVTFGGDRGAGLLALLVSSQTYDLNGRAYQIIMVPTAPVPFGGALLFAPSDSIQPADMSVDGLMSIYVSMGVTAPRFMKPALEPLAPPSDPPGKAGRDTAR